MHEQRTILRRRLQGFRALQPVYMPSATAFIAQTPSAQTSMEKLEDVVIGLPSHIPLEFRVSESTPDLADLEASLRDAQCRDALGDLRNQLQVKQRLYTYKKLHVRHQGANTRAQTDLANQDVRVRAATAKYRRARHALLELRGPGEWQTEFLPLDDKDIRMIQDDDPEAVAKRKRRAKDTGQSEGHRVVSWIWRASDARGDAGLVESLRVEWCKMRARTMRWAEEVRLLPEEMRRSLSFLEWQEGQWLGRVGRRPGVHRVLQEGLTAYALNQARVRRAIRGRFRDMWANTAASVGGGSGPEWAPVVDLGAGEGTEEEGADKVMYRMLLERQQQEDVNEDIPTWL